MNKKQKEALAAAAAALETANKNFDAAKAAFELFDKGDENAASAGEWLKAATEDLEKAQAAYEALKPDEKSVELVKVRALLPLAAKFLLPHDPGTEFEIEKKQGEEIVKAKCGEYVKQ